MKRKPTRRLSAARAAEAVAPATPPSRTQQDLRQRRRGGLRVAYDGSFSLTTEIAEICGPLAERASHQRNPPFMFTSRIAEMVDAIHGELVSGVVGWLAEAGARERVEREYGQLDTACRAEAVRHLVTIAQRPPEPQITPDDITSGRWVDVLVDLAAPHDAPLSDLLRRSYPPGDPQLRGAISRSDKLVDLLRAVDHAARQLDLRIHKAETAAAKRAASAPPTRADMARNALRTMGIEVPTP